MNAVIQFYDSVNVASIPPGAEYAALYCDGEYRPPPAAVRRFPHRRWITVTGDYPHAGIADFEPGNQVYEDPQGLRRWCARRLALGYSTPIVYADRADAQLAAGRLRGLGFYWWIPTLDGRDWTAAELAADLALNWGVTVPAGVIWANQNDSQPGLWDRSTLFGIWGA